MARSRANRQKPGASVRIHLGIIKDTIPQDGTTARVSRFRLATTTDTIGGIRNGTQPSQRDRLAATITVAISASLDSFDRLIDCVQLAAFRLDQLAIQFVLDRIGRCIEHVTGSFLVQLAQQAKVTFQSSLEGIATPHQLLSKFLNRFFSRHRITSLGKEGRRDQAFL
jgi:hypothetical protein